MAGLLPRRTRSSQGTLRTEGLKKPTSCSKNCPRETPSLGMGWYQGTWRMGWSYRRIFHEKCEKNVFHGLPMVGGAWQKGWYKRQNTFLENIWFLGLGLWCLFWLKTVAWWSSMALQYDDLKVVVARTKIIGGRLEGRLAQTINFFMRCPAGLWFPGLLLLLGMCRISK